MNRRPRPRAETALARPLPPSRWAPWAAILLLAALALGAPAHHAGAQPLPPRLVVFEGFYNPG